MKNHQFGLAIPTDATIRAENEEIIQRLNEKYPSPNRPYRHDTATDGFRGEIVYAMSAI